MNTEPAIRKTPGVCGGRACIRQTRIAVWLLILMGEHGASAETILESYPGLSGADLDAAWDYYRDNTLEIERDIWENDTAGDVPEGGPVPASVIVEGKLLGLDDETIRDSFDPPLAADAVAAAWREYRAEPQRVRGTRTLATTSR